jgi:hypothetical protein
MIYPINRAEFQQFGLNGKKLLTEIEINLYRIGLKGFISSREKTLCKMRG